MADQHPTPPPTSGGPLPPWLRRPSAAPAPSQPLPTPSDIPGPWSRPVSLKPAAPSEPQPTSTPASEAAKDWGPIKPIRTVPKPDEKKVAYILAQTEHVVNPEEEGARKKWIILGSIIAFLVIAGGTLAFVFFGRNTQTPKLDTNSVTIVNTKLKNSNVNTNDVFPSTNTYRNVNASNENANTTLDSDSDGLTDKQEALYGTDPKKPDTDGDGYTDGQEVQSGYNPLGPGKL